MTECAPATFEWATCSIAQNKMDDCIRRLRFLCISGLVRGIREYCVLLTADDDDEH